MPHAKHRAPRTPSRAARLSAVTGPLALAALGATVAPAVAQAAPATSAPTVTPVATAGPTGSAGSYTVKSGDTLGSIASGSNVPGGWQAIASLNALDDPNSIMPGQQLSLPGGSGGSSGGDTSTGASTASPAASTGTSGMVAYAKGFTGTPYVWGGMSSSGVDCSGLTSLVLKHAGFSPPRTSGAQYSWAQHISASAAKPGDLVFGYFSGGTPGHVGIYAGNGKMIDAPTQGQTVGLHSVPSDARYGRPGASG